VYQEFLARYQQKGGIGGSRLHDPKENSSSYQLSTDENTLVKKVGESLSISWSIELDKKHLRRGREMASPDCITPPPKLA
jgi:hypothetical protein